MTMTLSNTPLAEVLAAFRSSSPTPGGGSASALAGALGASLLAMVGSMPRHRAASEEDVDRLQAAAARCTQLSQELAALIDRDSDAYDSVVAAYKLPKATEAEKAERSARIQQGLAGASDVPLDVMQHCAAAIEHAIVIARFGNPNAASDVGVALELLAAAMRGARLNVEINLGSIKDATYVERVRSQVEAIAATSDTRIAAAQAARSAD
jgi:methenyltetrahydrofolate cyclohydrolase